MFGVYHFLLEFCKSIIFTLGVLFIGEKLSKSSHQLDIIEY